MNRRTVLAATAALGLCTAMAVGRAVAHPPDGDPPPPPGMHMGGPGPWGPGKVEERLTKLHDELKLSPDQAAAWETFATQAKERAAQARADRPDPETWAKLSAPERLDQIAATMKERQADLEAMAQSLRTFYAVLTPEQQKIVDEHFRFRGPGPHGPHGRRWERD
jgi:Spy/CpxP family protein refolding chaperone